MKKSQLITKTLTIITTLSIMFLTSCDSLNAKKTTETKSDNSSIKVTHLMEQVNAGLTKVELNDSTTILIYRGVESSAMIQLK